MKAWIVLIGLVLPTFGFANDQFQNFADAQRFVMVSAQMDPHHVPPLSVVTTGEMIIEENQIHLFIDFKKNCPPEHYCSDELPEPIDIVLPITERVRGRCLLTYVASIDRTPVDGILERVSARVPICDNEFESPQERTTEVTYTTEGYDRRERQFKYDSVFVFQEQ